MKTSRHAVVYADTNITPCSCLRQGQTCKVLKVGADPQILKIPSLVKNTEYPKENRSTQSANVTINAKYFY